MFRMAIAGREMNFLYDGKIHYIIVAINIHWEDNDIERGMGQFDFKDPQFHLP